MVVETIIIGLMVTTFSSFPETIAAPQEVPAVILALIAASIFNAMPVTAEPEAIFFTVVATIALTSLSVGLAFLTLGYCKCGNLVRFLPYPVVGGFLAGTGWLLITGAVSVMTDVTPDLSSLPFLFQGDMLPRWLAALIFAILLLVVMTRYKHFIVMPTMILAGVGLFYAVIWMAGASAVELGATGWLLAPPECKLPYTFTLSSLAQVNWSVVLGQAGDIAVLIVISIVSLLLNTSGLELVAKKDMDMNRELQVAGIGNMICGLTGGLVGFHLLSETTLSQKIGGRGRTVGIVVAAFCGGALCWGRPLLSFCPKMLLGSMLIMLGLSFLIEWVYKAWFKFSRFDYCIILSILIVIAGVGFLQGVVTGVILTAALFVINYSRINVVSHFCSSESYQSRVKRCRSHRKMLMESGDEVKIFQLQGFIFFGTASSLLSKMQDEIKKVHPSKVRFIVFDFSRVTGLDSTATLSFTKIMHLAEACQIALVFTNRSVDLDGPGKNDSVATFFFPN